VSLAHPYGHRSRPAMLSIPPHTHAFRCRRPGPAPIYLASPPTVTGHVNTARTSYLGCALRTARLNDDCRPHPTTVAAAPHYPHTRPPDVPARLVYQRILVNTYRTSDLCRPPGRARPPSAYSDRHVFALTRVVPASTSLVLDAASETCRTVRTTLWLPAVLLAAVHAVLLIDMMKIVTVLGANPIFRQMMQAFERCHVKSLEDFPRHIHSLFLVLSIQFRWER